MAASENKAKVFNDSVHGSIELPELCVKIIDTPQFQRLRNIKQLGGAYLVYPGASHNRFEHSIGTCYLAGELVKKLQRDQQSKEEVPDVKKITDQDVMCVMIAGLCHDLGHGPYSHLFDKHFVKLVDPATDWKHEEASEMLFDYMLKENESVRRAFEDYFGIFPAASFIKELIHPPEKGTNLTFPGKTFLYEIVSNEENKIDVDKWDYFARDCHHLGMNNSFDHMRLIKFARVIGGHIGYRDKERHSLYEMFHTRETLHRRAYQHKTTIILEHMLAEALYLAEISKLITLPGKEEKPLSIYQSKDDPVAYTALDDTIFWLITNTDVEKAVAEKVKDGTLRNEEEEKARENLGKAKTILERITSRQHYRFICDVRVENKPTAEEEEDLKKEIKDANLKPHSERNDIVIMKAYFDYGAGSNNPIKSVIFYNKQGEKVTDEPVSRMLPEKFSECVLNFYLTSGDDWSKDELKKAEHFISQESKIIKKLRVDPSKSAK